MILNPKIFKAYDIRGIYKQDLDEDLAYELGLAFVYLMNKKGGEGKKTIAISGDARLSTPSLKKSLIKGIIDAGADVLDIGQLSTPSFYFGVSYFNCDGGIMVSASHNPKEWNGFKLTRDKARPISGETGINELKEIITSKKALKSDTKGEIIKTDKTLEAQIKHDFEFFNVENIKPLKVVVDPGNGMGAQYTKKMFEKLSCDLIKINFEIDGTFPAHEADPIKEENLVDLKNKILEEEADLGIALDGDGDRVFFIDNEGKTINQAIIRGILSKIFLKERPGSKICYDIRPGKITEDMILENGGIPIVTKVGHSLIKEKALEEGAYFAGESSGHFFLNMEVGCFEVPVIIIGKLLEEFSKSNKTVSKYIKPLDKYYHSGEINSEVSDKAKVFENIERKYSDGEINKLDGISVKYPDFWFNVRGSNTEEKVRLNLEAKSEGIMEKRKKEVLDIINK